MKIKKSDIILMAEIIMDYKNYYLEIDVQNDCDKAWRDKVDKLDSKLWGILNNKNIEIK